jgi:hypothetical protein
MAVAVAQEKVNPGSLVQADFTRRVADYLKLHKTALSEAHPLKPTNSSQAIEHHVKDLASEIREARAGAKQGDLFTPEIAAEFRRLLGITMQGPEAQRVRTSLKAASPVQPQVLRVNARYPAGVPLQSTPSSLLLNLPPLPAGVQYRIVGRDLILLDTEADLIVDFIRNAIP